MSLIMSDKFVDALAKAGVIHEPEHTRRVVIDCQVGEVPVIYVERFGDVRLVEVAPLLTGIELRTASAAVGSEPADG